MRQYWQNLLFACFFCLVSAGLIAQANEPTQFNPDRWGIVLEHPDMQGVVVQKDVIYLRDSKRDLHCDIYLPPNLRKNEKRAAIVFLNGIGDDGDSKMKSWRIYSDWAKLVAVNGYVGITMESDRERIPECFDGLLAYLNKKGSVHQIDASRLGVYSASANTRASAAWLMQQHASPSIKAAVFYYGEVPPGTYRKDLAVLFVVADKDVRGANYTNLWAEVINSKAPWTIRLAAGLPHAFDALSDNDAAKRVILETLSFWKTHLDHVPISSTPPSKVREILAAQYENDPAKIIVLLREWFRDNPESLDPGALSLFANALMRTNAFAEAEIYFKKSLEVDQNNKGILLNMVIVSYALGKPDEAERYLAAYETDSKADGFTYGYIGRWLLGLKKYDIAAQCFDKAITLGPHPSDYYNLARCQAVAGEKDKAFDNLTTAVEKGFNNGAAYEADTDLASLKNDARWGELRKKLR